MRFKVPVIHAPEERKSKLFTGKCERCGRKKPLAIFRGKEVCSSTCYVSLNYRRKCPHLSAKKELIKKNKFKKFDDELFEGL